MIQQPIWTGVVDTWQEACETSGDVHAFLSERWLERITAQLQQYRDAYASTGTAIPPRPSMLPWVCSCLAPRTIVDLGGSSGWCYDYVRHTVPQLRIERYWVLELPAVADAMQRRALQGEPVRFVSSPDSIAACELLYSNSALQYFESNERLTTLLERTKPAAILLDDLMAVGTTDFFTTQKYYGSVIPYRFIGLETLLAELRQLGYSLTLAMPYASPVFGRVEPLPMDNFPASHRIQHSLSILCRLENECR